MPLIEICEVTGDVAGTMVYILIPLSDFTSLKNILKAADRIIVYRRFQTGYLLSPPYCP